jgi:hypothetical protein
MEQENGCAGNKKPNDSGTAFFFVYRPAKQPYFPVPATLA